MSRAWGGYRLFVAVDFDGTLAPLAPRPERARLPAAARRALERLAARPDVLVAIASGRALSTLQPKVGLPELIYAGNHGLDVAGPGLRWRHPGLPPLRAALRRVVRRASALAATVPGAWVEDKVWSLSVHVRAVRSPTAALGLGASLMDCMREEPTLRLAPGKKVFEIRTRLPWDKGDAIMLTRRRLAPGAVTVFIGDDTNDEEGFRTLGARALCVKVGQGASKARWRARDTKVVARLLERLAKAD
ncbi:MAG: trehalose-phosphatase [Elusimicrobia bacterium]|nr:trehalose-phosphatase [Elusimicrobiota bacterium]